VSYDPGHQLRWNDYRLDDDQQALSDAFGDFFRKECPTDLVRLSEPLGFDRNLWERLVAVGGVSMAFTLDEEPSATLVDLVLVAEQAGRRLAPVPWIETVVAARLLARLGAAAAAGSALAHGAPLAFGLRDVVSPATQLVPSAAVASAVVGLWEGSLVALSGSPPAPHVPNVGCSPLAWVAPDHYAVVEVLAEGDGARAEHQRGVQEWKLLMAASLVGLAEAALDDGVEYAKQRVAFDEPIGAFQAISHSLADVAIAVEGARRLVRKASWYAEHDDPDEALRLVSMAYLYAVRTAALATRVGVHVQGGFGLTLESDQQLYFRRSRGWPLVNGDPRAELTVISGTIERDHVVAGGSRP